MQQVGKLPEEIEFVRGEPAALADAPGTDIGGGEKNPADGEHEREKHDHGSLQPTHPASAAMHQVQQRECELGQQLQALRVAVGQQSGCARQEAA